MKREKSTDNAIVIDKPYIAAFEDTLLRDPRLTWKAKGIGSYLFSKPPGWQIWTNDLIKRSKDGRDAVLAGLAELEACGYLTRERTNGEGGRLVWRKRMTARPASMWTDEPAEDEPQPDIPVMDDPPQPGFPYTAKPSTDNPPHSITHSSISNSREVERWQTPTPAAESAPAAQESAAPPPPAATDALAMVAVILADCGVKVPPENLATYGADHVLAEAVRFWNETNHHDRARSSGLLVYRIRNRKYKPLTDYERAGCSALARWLGEEKPDQDEPTKPVEVQPVEESPAIAHEPGAPVDLWLRTLEHIALGDGRGTEGNKFYQWLCGLRLSALADDGTLTLYAADPLFLDWAARQFAPRLRRILSVQAGRPISVKIVAEQAAAA